MNTRLISTLFLSISLLISSITLAQTPVDANESSVTFVIKNAGIRVDGSFERHSIKLLLNDAGIVGLTGTAEVASIDTGIGMRDRHLQKKGYFDVDNHPQIALKSSVVQKRNDKTMNITFLLTLKGVEKKITFPVTVKREGNSMLLSGSFEINRIDFGVGSNSLTLSDEVVVNVEGRFMVP
jgi:polyisoprenoid-binding protein YceI